MAEEHAAWKSTVCIDDTIVNNNGFSNAITTTKYSLLSWLPKSLFEQFRRIANIYFLVISIIMLIGTYAPSLWQTPLDAWSTVGTLVVVLMITCVKEGLEDIQRYKSDTSDNESMVTIVDFEGGKLCEHRIQKQFIKAGDIIKLQGKCQVPADMVLVFTSNYMDGNQCYIETSNIDGETNLKLREAPTQLMGLVRHITPGHPPTREIFQGHLEFEAPNKNIHNFVGALHNDAIPGESMPLSTDNLLLRSSLFSNTDWAYGIAVYVGKETKVQMNNRHAHSKIGRLEQYLNDAIILIFIAQFVLVTISVISLYIMGFDDEDKLPYVFPEGTDSQSSIFPLWFTSWIVFFLLFNNFIPISLYVTIELVNVGQAFVLSNDRQIYDEDLDCAAVVRSSNLCQELGMVSNIFSDKTGTLTRNEMKFVKFVVNGIFYDVEQSENCPVLNAIAKGKNEPKGGVEHKQAESLLNFFRCLAVCHTVVREKTGEYRAESPDELALVEGVDKFRCSLIERGTSQMIVSIIGDKNTYSVLAVNAFNADRKRMSILVSFANEATGDTEYHLMCKGADNIIMGLCDMTEAERQLADKNLLDFAMLGLRTLCVASKKLSQQVALDWVAKYKAAASAINDRVNLLASAAAEIEQHMNLIGITAIEDRLQDEVPEVIADLAQAGIVLWMLTGDKEETAVSIGRSCNLIKNDTKTHFISKLHTKDAYNSRLKYVYHDMMSHRDPVSGLYMEDGKAVEVTVVMDGPSYKFFDEDSMEHRKWLLFIGQQCRSVIACRLTPVQKQMLVRLVKKDTVPQATTLAIGDGANDVSMIREGNVGVGIFGKEGRQAANNADFAIGQFKFLKRLLLVHGRWNYSRQSRVFLYSMHKNMVLTLTLYWFCYYSAMSGTSLYESWVYTGYNFILGLPIIVYGILDKDLSDVFQLRYPQTYFTGRDNSYLNLKSICTWIGNAVMYAVLLCLLEYVVMWDTFKSYSLYVTGTMVYTALCMSLQFKVSFLYHQWSIIHVIIMAISVGGMIFFFWVLNALPIDYVEDYGGEADESYNKGIYWLWCFISVPVMCVMIDLIGYAYQMLFEPTKEMLYREFELAYLFQWVSFSKLMQTLCLFSTPSVDGRTWDQHRKVGNKSSIPSSYSDSDFKSEGEFHPGDAEAHI